jgi:hypothetical protein
MSHKTEIFLTKFVVYNAEVDAVQSEDCQFSIHRKSERSRTFVLDQWYSTWGTRTPGGTRRHLRGYVKFKKIYYFMINTE